MFIPVVQVSSNLGEVRTADHGPEGSHLVEVGPISGDNGYPVWYRDATGLRLELCLEVNNPLCGFVLPDPEFNHNAPLVVPGNFPGESFWLLGDASLSNGATLGVQLEAAFSADVVRDGDQVSFGRVRIRVDEGLVEGLTYTVTHPYGVDTFVAEAEPKQINFTEDIGIGGPGDFTGALNSRTGPFLTWSDFPNSPGLPNLPNGLDAFVGDPDVLHAVTGSPFDTNIFRIEGPAGSFTGSPDLCSDPALGESSTATDDCIETSLFSLVGKVATNAGVTAHRATYSRVISDSVSLDLFAQSERDQSISVSANASFPTTPFTGDGRGRYFARVSFPGEPPATVEIRNASDVPATNKTIAVVDGVKITQAVYDSDLKTLTVVAESSDKVLLPALTLEDDFGPIGVLTSTSGLLTATLTVTDVVIAPDTITVRSAKGGFDTAHPEVQGAGFAPAQVVAGITVSPGQAISNTTLTFNVQQGQLITLDGTSSSGGIDSYLWELVGGNPPEVTLANANTAVATFEAPLQTASLTFRLTVTRNDPDASDTKDVVIQVLEAGTPVANAGPDQLDVAPGATVTLDGSASANATSFSWTQIGTPAVTLTGANTARPTFTFPLGAGTLTFQLAVNGPGGGPVTDTVNIVPSQDQLTLIRALYETRKTQWRVEGTAAILGAPAGPGNQVTVTLLKAGGAEVGLGTAPVDATGAWVLRFTTADPNLQPVAADRIRLTSSRGAVLTNQVITIK